MISWMQTCFHHTCGYLCTNKRPLQPDVLSLSKQLSRQSCSCSMQSRHSHSRIDVATVIYGFVKSREWWRLFFNHS